jgi:hypothetical protein
MIFFYYFATLKIDKVFVYVSLSDLYLYVATMLIAPHSSLVPINPQSQNIFYILKFKWFMNLCVKRMGLIEV